MNMLTFDIAFTLLVLAGVIYVFVRERLAAHLAALGAMALLLLAGILDTEQALSVFANPAPVTIAALFVIAAALDRTGVLDAMGRAALRQALRSRRGAVLVLLVGTVLVSAFVNNTPVVIVMTPVLIAVAGRLREYPSRLLLPMGFAAIFGGTCTLIGTSTNLLVDGVGRTHGQAPFTVFEIFVPGVLLAVVGMACVWVLGRRWLPDRPAAATDKGLEGECRYLAEGLILRDSPLTGQTLNDVRFSEKGDYEIVDLIRSGEAEAAPAGLLDRMWGVLEAAPATPEGARSALRDVPLQAGDRLLFKSSRTELLQIRNHSGITFSSEELPERAPLEPAGVSREPLNVEGIVGPGSPAIGRNLGQLRWRRQFGCQVLGIHRGGENVTDRLGELALRQGDRLLLEGPRDEMEKLFERAGIMSLGQLRRRAFDRGRAPLVIAVLLGVVVLSATGVMPIAGLALAGATVLIITGCVTAEAAYAAIQWRVLMLIFGMLGISAAMDSSGAARLLVEQTVAVLDDFGPLAALAVVYLFASLLTEVMSNNAVALLLTAIAIGLAESMGVDPRPFMVAVMFGASASFATPVGYQVNALIYVAGNYRFGDFLRIGIPLKIVLFIATMLIVPLFWPLTPTGQ